MWSNFSDKAQADTGIGTRSGFAMTMGLQHKFRMSPRVDFHLEMKSLLCNTDMLPIELKERSSWGVSLTAGFAYRFGRRGWDRVGDIAYTAEDLAPYQRAAEEKQQQLDEAERQNEALQKQLRQMTDRALAAEAAAEEAKKPVVEDKVNGLILFNIGHSTLDKKEQLRLEQLAEMIKQGPKEHRYKLEGYADKQTGTPEINARLAQERAKRVYDFLVEQGVDPDCLSYEGKPNENPYRRQETNRSVAIK
ncbi:MAG: OmpA family protein [Alistipes sp.]|nr:OmpA family protein [Alistipes sp.]